MNFIDKLDKRCAVVPWDHGIPRRANVRLQGDEANAELWSIVTLSFCEGMAP